MGSGAEQGSLEGRRLVAFARLAEALAHAATVEEAARAITDHLALALGAAFANLALVEPDDLALRVVNPAGLDPAIADRYETLPRSASTPLTDSVRTGTTVLVASAEENAARYPSLSSEADALGLLALAAVPIRAAGAVCGAIGVGWTEPFVDLASLQTRLASIGELVSGAIERALMADTRAALIGALQAVVLPVVVDRPGLEVATRHQPAGSGLGFGGDWFDLIDLDDDRTAVVVGDVVGHGIEAAARMVQVRSALHAVVRLGVPVEEVFARAGPVIGIDGQMVGTAVVAVVDRAAGTVRYARAGHPPLVLVGPDGLGRVLQDTPSVVLGLAGAAVTASTVPFPPGSVLLAYTDGLVETRSSAITVGIDRVVHDLEGALAASSGGGRPTSLDGVASALLAGAGDPADLEDDVALVVVRRTT